MGLDVSGGRGASLSLLRLEKLILGRNFPPGWFGDGCDSGGVLIMAARMIGWATITFVVRGVRGGREFPL